MHLSIKVEDDYTLLLIKTMAHYINAYIPFVLTCVPYNHNCYLGVICLNSSTVNCICYHPTSRLILYTWFIKFISRRSTWNSIFKQNYITSQYRIWGAWQIIARICSYMSKSCPSLFRWQTYMFIFILFVFGFLTRGIALWIQLYSYLLKAHMMVESN